MVNSQGCTTFTSVNKFNKRSRTNSESLNTCKAVRIKPIRVSSCKKPPLWKKQVQVWEAQRRNQLKRDRFHLNK